MKEIKQSNQAEANGTCLAYEPPKLQKHGTIHEMTLTTFGGSTNDNYDEPNYQDVS